MYYLVYEIKNKINDKIYIGAHKTKDLNDGYMGSGKSINQAIKKHGVDNFSKRILHFCSSEEEMYLRESEIVTDEFIKSPDNYNIKRGGHGGFESAGKSHFFDGVNYTWLDVDKARQMNYPHIFTGKVNVKDADGNILNVSVDDPRYLSGELQYFLTDTVMVRDDNGNFLRVGSSEFKSGNYTAAQAGKVTVVDVHGNTMSVCVDDSRYLSGELVSVSKGKATAVDSDGNHIIVQAGDPRFQTGEIRSHSLGMVMCKDSAGVVHRVHCTDERLSSGELVGVTSGHKLSDETKAKMSESSRGKVIVVDSNGSKFQVDVDDPRFLCGELKHVTRGKMWIHHPSTLETRRIDRDSGIPDGWKPGRNKIKI